MNSGEIVELYREEMNDEAEPFLWSDKALFVYLDATVKNFYRWTEGIEDSSTPEIAQATLLAGESWLTLDPRVLKVREVVNAATGRPYKVHNMESAAAAGIVFDGRPGRVHAFVTGLERRKLRAWPVTTEDLNLELRVFRLPLESITDAGDQELELDEQHHYHLLLGMKAMAYGKEDAETFNRQKAEEFEARFRAYCDQARREQIRARRDVGVVAYGGL